MAGNLDRRILGIAHHILHSFIIGGNFYYDINLKNCYHCQYLNVEILDNEQTNKNLFQYTCYYL